MAEMRKPRDDRCRLYQGAAAVERLAEYGLRPDYFVRALMHGHDRQLRCLPVHPRTYRGVVMWAETVSQLRTELLNLNLGWQLGHSKNYETAFRRDLDMAVAVVAGDINTGMPYAQPKTARRRGPVTISRVRRNAVQGELALDLPPSAASLNDDELCATWFFLLRARQDVMYSELSMPGWIGTDGKLVTWDERIILEPVPLAGAVTPISPDGDDEGTRPAVHVERI